MNIHPKISGSPESPSSIHEKKEMKSKASRQDKIEPEEMVKAVKEESKKVVISVRISPPRASIPLEPLEKEAIVKSVKSDKPSVSPTRQIPGKRIYHIKQDTHPWIKNLFKSGNLSNDYIYDQFKTLIESRQDLSPTQKQTLLKIADEEVTKSKTELRKNKETTMQLPELSEDLEMVLLPDKSLVNTYKSLSKSIEKGVHDNIQSCASRIKARCLEQKGLPENALQTIVALQENLSKNARNLEGFKRFELIHKQPFWDPEKATTRYFSLNKEDEPFLGINSFQAVGPAYSSQAPRNRTEKESCPANFLRSTFSIQTTDETKQTLLNITRSATTVEFDQKDEKKRMLANQKNLEQVIDQQVDHLVHQLAEKNPKLLRAAESPDTPLILKGQTVNLLTPDILRSLAREHPSFKKVAEKIHHNFSGAPADDERALALENLEAHFNLNERVMPYTVLTPDGEQKTIYVKYNLRYFNIPNNVLYAKMPKILTDCKELTDSNNESWIRLEQDVREELSKLDSQIRSSSKNVSSTKEKNNLSAIYKEMTECSRLREEIMQATTQKEYFDKKQFKTWQEKADQLAEKIKILEEDSSSSNAFKEALALIKQKTQLLDLYLDTRELFLSGLSKNLRNMDNNRSALATRIILLGSMVEELQVHFGCRSGKDRTGLVDIEIKLLAALGYVNGRIPSYHEQEQLPDVVNFRETLTQETGNDSDIVTANLGANLGMNTGGAASKPLNKSPTSEQYNEVIKATQGFSGMASRPPTNWIVPSGYKTYWDQHRSRVIQL